MQRDCRLERNLGSIASAGLGLEIGVVALEAEHGRCDVVGEQLDIGVVALHGFVVLAALHRDAIFSAGQFVLQAQEIFVGFQLRIIFHHHQQAAESAVQL